jgi:hypothetical protein
MGVFNDSFGLNPSDWLGICGFDDQRIGRVIGYGY